MLNLAFEEVVADRPFTHIQNNAEDLSYLEHARALLRGLLRTQAVEEYHLVDLELVESDPSTADSNYGYRLIITNRPGTADA